jgi:dUTP pyrophosphatase
MSILTKFEILELIQKEDMISGYLNLNHQLQPNGFDLCVDNIYQYNDDGYIGWMDKRIPDYKPVEYFPNLGNMYFLQQGAYSFDILEIIKLPLDVCAVTIQRSSIMRCGCITNVGFWDSGYNGKGFSQLMVNNPYGLHIKKGANIIQMIFLKNTKETEGYNGSYQKEGINTEYNGLKRVLEKEVELIA